MHRRTWLRLGLASAAVLAVGGGALAWIEPGLTDGKLGSGGRRVFHAVGRALLDGSLPAAEPARMQALAALLERIDALAGNLPPHAQAELSQLLSLLASAVGRQALAGVGSDWEQASISELQHGLQAMRLSAV